MRYVARKRRAFRQAGWPVISVDAKQRELIGNLKNPVTKMNLTRYLISVLKQNLGPLSGPTRACPKDPSWRHPATSGVDRR